MKKNEYLEQLRAELKKNNVPDMDDILSEYEQHFAFKLADGCSEEEIAAKLGSPQTIAAQFDSAGDLGDKRAEGNFLLKASLFFVAIFETMFYILFFAWNIVLAAAAISSAVLGVCLIGGSNIAGLIPYMPYFGSLILGISILGLAALLAAATVYCFAFLKQMIKACVRWHRNMTSAGALPPLPWDPQFEPKTKRTLRNVTLWAFAVFGACFVLAYVILALEAGAIEFWHKWNWFVG